MTRPSLDRTFMEIAHVVAKRGTCARRRVGCVLVSGRGHLLSTGYNGPPTGHAHCIDIPCPGAAAASGQSLDLCEAVHAEMNAIAQCQRPDEIYTCYTTVSPCLTCTKLLINTGCRRIIFSEEYPHPLAKERWLRIPGRDWLWEQLTFD